MKLNRRLAKVLDKHIRKKLAAEEGLLRQLREIGMEEFIGKACYIEGVKLPKQGWE